jgi:thymidylate synthase (FAD)
MQNNTVKVLDYGFVKLRNLAGPTRRKDKEFDADDIDPANAARQSFDNLDNDVYTYADGRTRPRTRQDDYKLNTWLLSQHHTSPFEQVQVWLEVKVPIFVDRQFVRHRTWRRNESSGRYIVLPEEFYIPEIVGGKADNKKQGQDNNLAENIQNQFKNDLLNQCLKSYQLYLNYIELNVAPEHARMFLHLNHYVHWLGNVDLHNLFHFLALRTHSHAQVEARAYGFAIVELLRPHLPELMGLFDQYCRIPEK